MNTRYRFYAVLFSWLAIMLFVVLALVMLPWRVAAWHTQNQLKQNPAFLQNLQTYDEIGDSWNRSTSLVEVLRPVTIAADLLAEAGQWEPVLEWLDEQISGSRIMAEATVDATQRTMEIRDAIRGLARLDRVYSETKTFLAEPSKVSLRSLGDLYQEGGLALERVGTELEGVRPYVESTQLTLKTISSLLEMAQQISNGLLRSVTVSFLETMQVATQNLTGWLSDLMGIHVQMQDDARLMKRVGGVIQAVDPVVQWIDTTPIISAIGKFVESKFFVMLGLFLVLISVSFGLFAAAAKSQVNKSDDIWDTSQFDL